MSKTIWIFDDNKRVYTDENGKKYSGPIWRKHWVPYEVIHETSRSWVLSTGRKVTKNIKWPESSGVCFSREEVNQRTWVHDNAHRIADEVRRLPYDKLTQVNDLLATDSKPSTGTSNAPLTTPRRPHE